MTSRPTLLAVGAVALLAGAFLLVRLGIATPALGAVAVAIGIAGAFTALRTLPRTVAFVIAALSGGLAAWSVLSIHEDLRGERPDTGPDPLVRRPDPPGVSAREAWLLPSEGDVLSYRGIGPHAAVVATGLAAGRPVHLDNAPRDVPEVGGPPASKPASLRFVVWGDCRGGVSVFEQLVERARELRPAFSIGAGDLVGMARTYQFEIVRDRLAKTGAPAYVVPGNHDLDPFGTLRPYARVFGPRNWSFVEHETLFVGFDSARGVIDPADVTWLETTVSERGPGAPHVILFCHHPLWMPASHDEKPLPEDAATGRVKALCESVKAHVFCSHFHGYDDRTVGSVRQVTTGGAGARLEGEGPFHFVQVDLEGSDVRIERVDLGGPSIASPRLDRLLTFRDEGAYVARRSPGVAFLIAAAVLLAIGGLVAASWPRRRAGQA